VNELLEAFEQQLGRRKGLTIAFLVGGAGNGKSFAARKLANQLSIPTAETHRLAKRSYTHKVRGTTVEILNDATIAPRAVYKERQGIALAADIARWVGGARRSPWAAFCCVNRGIVVDELRLLVESPADSKSQSVALSVLRWLANPQDPAVRSAFSGSQRDQTFISPPPAWSNTYNEVHLEVDGTTITLAALAVDAHSLFDRSGGYTTSTAEKLFQEVVSRCEAEIASRPTECPIRANLLQWTSTNGRKHWRRIFASAEVAAGRLYSYRDVWGIAALSILGPKLAEERASDHLLEYIDENLQLCNQLGNSRVKLGAILRLARFRTHEGIFRAPYLNESLQSTLFPPPTPVHLGLSRVDPSIWSSHNGVFVERALQSMGMQKRASSELTDVEDALAGWSAFDQLVESAVLEFVAGDECSDNERRRIISWFGGYLTRHVGVATGSLGNAKVVSIWEQCFEASKAGPAPLPLELNESMRSLLFPPYQSASQGEIAVPALAARIEPISQIQEGGEPLLAELISHANVVLRVRRSGAKLLLETAVVGSDTSAGSLTLDFSLIREALACVGGIPGQTEGTGYIEPRIERARAASLQAMPFNTRRLVVMGSGSIEELAT
jgi:hypothetical protein